jgi:hypothetical protein
VVGGEEDEEEEMVEDMPVDEVLEDDVENS